MNAHRILQTFSLVGILVSASVRAGETNRHFLRSVGSVSQSNAQVRAVVTATAKMETQESQDSVRTRGRTNAHPTVLVTWRAGDVTDSSSKLMTREGWFVFVEQPSRIWVFDGDVLSLLEWKEKTVSISTASAEVLKSCPASVRDALPEQIQKRYFK